MSRGPIVKTRQAPVLFKPPPTNQQINKSIASPSPSPNDLFNFLEVPRKIWHGSQGFLVSFIYFVLDPSIASVLKYLVPPAMMWILFDWLRMMKGTRFDQVRSLFFALTGRILRPAERKGYTFTSTTWFLAGVIVVLVLCMIQGRPSGLAVLAILFLSWGDVVASVVGRLVNRTQQIQYPLSNSDWPTSVSGWFCMTWWEVRMRCLAQAQSLVPSVNRRARRQVMQYMARLEVPLGSKTIVGTIACITCCVLVTLVFIAAHQWILIFKSPALIKASSISGLFGKFFNILTFSWSALLTSIKAGLVGGLAELAGDVVQVLTGYTKTIDDDLVMPIVSYFMLNYLTPINKFLVKN